MGSSGDGVVDLKMYGSSVLCRPSVQQITFASGFVEDFCCDDLLRSWILGQHGTHVLQT